LRDSRCRNGAGKARVVLALLALAAFAASCGGPYTPKKLNLATEKLALADRLFDKGSHGSAAVEYKDFLSTFAGDERSDYAQFRLAESYRLDGDYALAEVEYRILINDYGYSDYVDDAFFLEGVCAFRQSPRYERDQTKTLVALERLNRFLQMFPSSSRAEEARGVLREIHEKLAHKDFTAAKLYFRKKQYDAAVVYLRKIIESYPETIWGERSRYYRGYIREANGEFEGAIEDYRSVLASKSAIPERAEASERLRILERELEGTRKTDGG
jgi:outer membrane protein assembly factor BamD